MEQVLPENPSLSSKNPFHTARCKVGWLHPLNQFQRAGRPVELPLERQLVTVTVKFWVSNFRDPQEVNSDKTYMLRSISHHSSAKKRQQAKTSQF